MKRSKRYLIGYVLVIFAAISLNTFRSSDAASSGLVECKTLAGTADKCSNEKARCMGDYVKTLGTCRTIHVIYEGTGSMACGCSSDDNAVIPTTPTPGISVK